MLGVLIALAAFCGLLWYLKAPRAAYWTLLGGASLLVLAARFLLSADHPVRVNAGEHLGGLVVVIFVAAAVVLYRYWFGSLKARMRGVVEKRADQPEPGFVIIDDDTALTRDVERLLLHDGFSVLRRGGEGRIAASCRVRIEGEVARLGSVYAPDGLSDLLAAVEEECDWRDAKMLVVEAVPEGDSSPYREAGFVEFGRIKIGPGLRVSMKKDLT